MKLVDLQIMFQQKAETINAGFFDAMRPTTFVIANYLNKAIDRYIREKFLNFPTHGIRRANILANMDVLKDMVENTAALTEDSLSGFPHGSATLRVILPTNMLSLISVYCTYTRSDVPPMTSDVVFSEFVPLEEARKLVTTDANKPIFPKPVASYENEFSLLLVGDAYTTAFTDVKIRYLRKPFDLSYTYQELEADDVGSDLSNIDSIVATDNYFRAFTKGVYVQDPGPTGLTFQAGDRVKKVSGQNIITGTGYLLWKQKIGAPYGQTDEPELPEHLHEELADLAVQIFMDEAKLKLTPKAQTA